MTSQELIPRLEEGPSHPTVQEGREALARGPANGATKYKVAPRRFPSDDCVVHIGQELSPDGDVIEEGEEVHVHQGEWVEIIPLISVGALLELRELTSSGDTSALRKISETIVGKITAWSWTGLDFKELPNPPDLPTIMGLPDDEWLYLLRLIQDGGTGTQRKNA